MTEVMSEERMVELVRNALLVAGFEMGETGEHWPVINDTIYKIAEDWEQLKITRNVNAEMKIHLYNELEIAEKSLAEAPPEEQAEYGPQLKELREIYDAYFSSVDSKAVEPINDDEIPDHIHRAELIINSLGGENA
jgi:hypothetical protein